MKPSNILPVVYAALGFMSYTFSTAHAGWFGPSNYDECVLDKTSGQLLSTLQVVAIWDACRNLFPPSRPPKPVREVPKAAGVTPANSEKETQGVEDDLAAIQRGDYATALKLWRSLAEQGNPIAQFNLGIMYDEGTGVPQDSTEAVKWYRKAADQGHAHAQDLLGLAYQLGRGVAADYAEAVGWYRKAAEQGIPQAQCELGINYEHGWGVPQDYSEAVKWYREAAQRSGRECERVAEACRKAMPGGACGLPWASTQ